MNTQEDPKIEVNSGVDQRQLVVFQLGGEGFCVDISKVREINRVVEITKIPEAPEFVEGVINLRGQIIPIIDLRKRFGMKIDPETATKSDNRIMVVETNGSIVGFIVDAVREVLRINSEHIEAAPDLVTSKIDRKYIEGVATIDQRLLIIVDADFIFATHEIQALDSGITAEAAA